jgi:LysR family transcriptional regulator, glycine cleavage system transcriptional activator
MTSRSSPPLVAIRCFEVAARRLSFSAAATELCVTPAAVSHQIRRLEQYLGVQLFVRLNRAVVLTAAGTALASRLHELFANLDQALVETSQPHRVPLQVSAMPSLAAKWLAPRLHRFESQNPSWSVRLVGSDHLVNFAHESVDVGVRYGAGNYSGTHTELLMHAYAFPVCSPQLLSRKRRPLRTPEDLQHHTLLHDETSKHAEGVPDWHAWLKASGTKHVDAHAGPVFGGIHLALEAAIAGHGVALALAPLVTEELASGRLVRPFDLELRSAFSFWIVCARARAHMPKIEAFRNWLLSEARARAVETQRSSR